MWPFGSQIFMKFESQTRATFTRLIGRDSKVSGRETKAFLAPTCETYFDDWFYVSPLERSYYSVNRTPKLDYRCMRIFLKHFSMPLQKRTHDSPAALLLFEKLQNWKLTGDELPIAVWKFFASFIGQKLSNYLSSYNNLRPEIGLITSGMCYSSLFFSNFKIWNTIYQQTQMHP